MPDDEYPDGSVIYAPHQGIIRLPFESIILTLSLIIFNFSFVLSYSYSALQCVFCIQVIYPSKKNNF